MIYPKITDPQPADYHLILPNTLSTKTSDSDLKATIPNPKMDVFSSATDALETIILIPEDSPNATVYNISYLFIST